jgi:hypothetical protein
LDPPPPPKKPPAEYIPLDRWFEEEKAKVVGSIKAVASEPEELAKRVMPQSVFSEYIKKNYPKEVWQPTGWVVDFIPEVGAPSHWAYRDLETGRVVSYLDDSLVRRYWDKHYRELMEEKRRRGEPLRFTREDIMKIGKLAARDYAEEQANKDKEYYLKYGRFSDKRVVETPYGYSIEELLTPEQQFLRDVEEGKIRDPVTGLKLSVNQVKGKPPDQGFLNEMLGGGDDYYKVRNNSPYYAGLVVKVCGDSDPELRDDHDTWAVITNILDPWHYEAIQEITSKKLILRDTDIKGWIGDVKHDFRGLGKERHENEVKPLIEKALRGKEPVPKYEEIPYEERVKRVRRMLHLKEYSIEKQRQAAEAELKALEAKKDAYDPEDYERLHRETEEELKAIAQVEEEIKRWGVEETIRRGWK